jgi:hypothetical protein
MKVGRNDDCPCGSGEKYKKCCELKEHDNRSSNRLFREREAALMERMLPFADEVFGEDAIDNAMQLFLDDEGAIEFEAEDPLNPFFMPWFLFNWYIEPGDMAADPEAPVNKTVCEAFLAANEANLAPELISLLRAANRRPMSFYEILDSVPGKSLTLRDLLQEKDLIVDEDEASKSLRKGEIIIGNMMHELDGRVRPLALGPFALEASDKSQVLDLRYEILENTGVKKLDDEVLNQQEAFVIGLYLDIIDAMLDESNEDERRH